MSRIIAVVEERDYVERGWRLRLVDDLIESLVNAATGAKMKIKRQGLDVMRLLLLAYAIFNMEADMYKGDVGSVFKLLMYDPAKWAFFGIMYLLHGKVMYMCHRTLCFGGVSSVFGWHRAAWHYSTEKAKGWQASMSTFFLV